MVAALKSLDALTLYALSFEFCSACFETGPRPSKSFDLQCRGAPANSGDQAQGYPVANDVSGFNGHRCYCLFMNTLFFNSAVVLGEQHAMAGHCNSNATILKPLNYFRSAKLAFEIQRFLMPISFIGSIPKFSISTLSELITFTF